MEKIILKRGMTVSHIFKVREGCGLGGNRKSVSVAYGFLGKMGCCYLLADQEIHFDWDLFDRLRGARNLPAFAVRKVTGVGNPSGFKTGLFAISHQLGAASDKTITSALRTIARGSGWERGLAKPRQARH